MPLRSRLVLMILCLNAATAAAAADIRLAPALDGRAFSRPVAMYQAPGGTDWFVLEQEGRVLRVSADGKTTTLFADLSAQIDSGPNEAGLLGLAFHPGFTGNRRVFVSYTAGGDPLTSIIAEYRSNASVSQLERNSQRIVLRLEQPFGNHNGGQISFGPDGYLYLGFGDGGAAGDPFAHGQNKDTLLGALLRIDVDRGTPYGIPPDNPFARGGGRGEIYAWGLRNPWRWSFDRQTGKLWLADVGQDKWEEVNLIERGGNYGWNIREGRHCFRNRNCSSKGLIDPVVEYGHDQGCSITGGYVYRGQLIPALRGWYVFADYCAGDIRAFDTRRSTPRVVRLLRTNANIASFAESQDGELYVLDHGGGRIYRLVADR